KQVVQEIKSGKTSIQEVPPPQIAPQHVLLAAVSSAISAGTERSVVNLARKSLIGKALERPKDVKRILEKIKVEGLWTTYEQTSARLDESMPLGYSAAGVILACGSGVQDFKPGDRIAAAAPHAAVSLAGSNLCAKIPDNVSFEQAAYTSIGSIAMQGVRLAKL